MSEWISVKERLPESMRSSVLIYTEDNKCSYTAYRDHCECSECDGHWYYFSDGNHDEVRHEVTHWMPLPDPPEVPNCSSDVG